MKRQRPTFEHACRTYVNRYTMEHMPAWALVRPSEHGGTREASWFYAPQYRSDREWYDNTSFPGEDRHIGRITECWSRNATWPLGQRLDQPFTPNRKR